MKRIDILEKKNLILKWIEEKQSKAFICKKVNCKPETLNYWLKQMGIEYRGNQSGKGVKKFPMLKKDALTYSKGTHVSTHKLRIKLVEEGIKEHKCEFCKLNEWLGAPIPIELHHIDGDRYNNNFSNLQILCPNCHALTDSNSGKNVGRYTKNK